jgi:hypothetical protein
MQSCIAEQNAKNQQGSEKLKRMPIDNHVSEGEVK